MYVLGNSRLTDSNEMVTVDSLCMVVIGASKPKIPTDTTTSAQTEQKNLKVPIKKGTIHWSLSVGKSGMWQNLVSHHIELATHQQNLAIEVVVPTWTYKLLVCPEIRISKKICLPKKNGVFYVGICRNRYQKNIQFQKLDI